jgi:cyclohexanone monooxygenase
VKVVDVSEEAEEAWTDGIVASFRDSRAFMAACTPSRLNFEGNPDRLSPRNGSYGGGSGDVFAFVELLAEWRDRGDFAGLELEFGTADAVSPSWSRSRAR